MAGCQFLTNRARFLPFSTLNVCKYTVFPQDYRTFTISPPNSNRKQPIKIFFVNLLHKTYPMTEEIHKQKLFSIAFCIACARLSLIARTGERHERYRIKTCPALSALQDVFELTGHPFARCTAKDRPDVMANNVGWRSGTNYECLSFLRSCR